MNGRASVDATERAPIIERKDVSRSYGEPHRRALRRPCDTRRFVAIVGDSGSDKTTMLKMTNRLLEPTSGEVRVDGEPTHSQPPHLLRRRIGYVFQRIGLFPPFQRSEGRAETISVFRPCEITCPRPTPFFS